MAAFFFICEYINITPRDFFDLDAQEPEELKQIIENLKKLNKKQLDSISSIVSDFTKNK